MPSMIPPFIANLALWLWQTQTHPLYNFASSLNVRLSTATRLRYLVAALLHRSEEMIDTEDFALYIGSTTGRPDYVDKLYKSKSITEWFTEITSMDENENPQEWITRVADIITAVLAYLAANKSPKASQQQQQSETQAPTPL